MREVASLFSLLVVLFAASCGAGLNTGDGGNGGADGGDVPDGGSAGGINSVRFTSKRGGVVSYDAFALAYVSDRVITIKLTEATGSCSARGISPGADELQLGIVRNGTGPALGVGTWGDGSGGQSVSVAAYAVRFEGPAMGGSCRDSSLADYATGASRLITITSLTASRVAGTYSFRMREIDGYEFDLVGEFDAQNCAAQSTRTTCQ